MKNELFMRLTCWEKEIRSFREIFIDQTKPKRVPMLNCNIVCPMKLRKAKGGWKGREAYKIGLKREIQDKIK